MKKEALSLAESEPQSKHPVMLVEHRGSRDDVYAEEAPVSGVGGMVLARASSEASTEDSGGNDPMDMYLQELSGSRPLSREGEVALGQRIEAGERAGLVAMVGCPLSLRVLASFAEEITAGRMEVQDLLLNPEAENSSAEAVRVAYVLRLAATLVEDDERGAAHGAGKFEELIQGLVDVRLDPAIWDRIERALREAPLPAHGRGAAGLALDGMARARRTIARAKAELVQANLRLVVATARQYQRRGVPLLDLVQEGNLGLMRAADKFDYRRGYRFSTYAGWWIKQAIERAVLCQGKPVRVPVHLADSRRKVLRARRALVQEHAREPSPEELAAASGLPVAKVVEVSELLLEPVSLDAPVGEDGDARYGDFMAGDVVAPDEALAKRRMKEQTLELLDALTPREREILRLRYGLDGDGDHTLEEIGRSFSLSRERIRQIESKALAKLRARSRELGGYLET